MSVTVPAAHEVEHLAEVAEVILDSAGADSRLRQTAVRDMFPSPKQWAEMREAESGKEDREAGTLFFFRPAQSHCYCCFC